MKTRFVLIACAATLTLGAQSQTIRYPVFDALQIAEERMEVERRQLLFLASMFPENKHIKGRIEGFDRAMTIVHELKISPIARTPFVGNDVAALPSAGKPQSTQ